MLTTIEKLNLSRRAARAEIAAWLRGARMLRRHEQHRHAAFIERHAVDFKTWAGARPLRLEQLGVRAESHKL